MTEAEDIALARLMYREDGWGLSALARHFNVGDRKMQDWLAGLDRRVNCPRRPSGNQYTDAELIDVPIVPKRDEQLELRSLNAPPPRILAKLRQLPECERRHVRPDWLKAAGVR